jgi:hypothetical protein
MPTKSTTIESKASYYVVRQQNISHNSKVLRVRPSFVDYCAILDFLAEAVAPL